MSNPEQRSYCPASVPSGDQIADHLSAASAHLLQAKNLIDGDPLCAVATQVDVLEMLVSSMWVRSLDARTDLASCVGIIGARKLLVEHLTDRRPSIPPVEVRERVEQAVLDLELDLMLQERVEAAKLADMAEWLDQQEALSDR